MNLKFMQIGAKSLCDINFICISVVFLLSFVSLQLAFLRVCLKKSKAFFAKENRLSSAIRVVYSYLQSFASLLCLNELYVLLITPGLPFPALRAYGVCFDSSTISVDLG